MTVSAQTPLNRSTGNGVTTVFPYTFKVLAEADMEVSVDGVVKTLTTDYTLSGVGTDSGNVTFVVAPAVDTVVVRRRNMAYTRSVDYQDQGELPTDTLDDDQDAPVLMVQQVAEEVGRSIRVAPESSGVDLELPAPTALSYLRWNALANALENVLLADISLISLSAYAQTLLDAVDAAAARVVLGFTAVGSAVGTAVDEAAARLAILAAKSGANIDLISLGNNTSTIYTTGGTSTAYTITPSPAITAYAIGQSFVVNFNAACGAAPTLQISGIATPPNLVKENGDGTFSNLIANAIPINHRSRVTLISTTQALVEDMPPAYSMVRLNTANGYGSTNTTIRRFTNVVTNQGGDITYADSATLGATFTINANGVYAVSYNDQFSSTSRFGLSLNSTQLTTDIGSITLADKLALALTGVADQASAVSVTAFLAAGSVIRAHTGGAATGASPTHCQFTITRVG